MCYYQNVGGINTRISEYRLACSDSCYYAYAMTETWLNEDTRSNQIFGPNYNVFRLDRNANNSCKKSGGGVLLALHCKHKPRQLSVPNSEAVEQLWVAISLQNHTLFACVIYIPPSLTQDANVIDQHINSLHWIIARMKTRDSLLIIGDFNLPGIKWEHGPSIYLYPDVTRSSISLSGAKLIDSYNLARASQLNYVENENGRMLDLCFGSIEGDIQYTLAVAPAPLVNPSIHHPPLLVEISGASPCVFSDTVELLYYDFKNGDYCGMNSFLSHINWHDHIDQDLEFSTTTFSQAPSTNYVTL